MTITITTTENHKNNAENNNMTVIDLGDCEIELRRHYNISDDKLLYMKKIDVVQEGMKISKVEFDVYCKLNGINLIRLNKSICEKTKVNIEVPVVILDNIDKLNTSSGYFNDICYIATSDSGTDITLEDRKKKFINNKEMVCQNDCDFTEYDYKLKKAKCSCKVKESSSSFADMNIDTKEFFQNLKNIKSLVNIDILKCYKVLFTKIGILNNIGFYIIIVILVFNIICIYILYKYDLIKIRNLIDDIIVGVKNNEIKMNNNDNKVKKVKKKKIKRKRININNQKNKKLSSEQMNTINISDINKNKSIKDNPNNIRNSNNLKNNIKTVSQPTNKELVNKVKKVMEYTNEELNGLEYNLALQYDRRTFSQYYISLLKIKHNLIFSFFNYDDYNSRIIKINLFVINFSINYGVNALFFNDETMHEIYESQGSFDLEYQLPQIIYSSLISSVLSSILKLLALSNDDICSLKSRKSTEDIDNIGLKLFKKL